MKRIVWSSPLVVSICLREDASFEAVLLCQGMIIARRPIPRALGVIVGGIVDQLGLTSQQAGHHRAQVERAKRAN